MTGQWAYISYIEDFFYTLLSSKDFGTVYVGDKMPDTLPKNLTRLTLVDCGNMRDLNAYGTGIVNVFLFSKSDGNGRKNVPVMAQMEDALMKAIKSNKHPHYVVSRDSAYADYDSKSDMHCNIVSVNLTIK